MKKHKQVHRRAHAFRAQHADNEPTWVKFTVATIVYALVFAFTVRLVDNVSPSSQVASGPATVNVLGAQSGFDDLQKALESVLGQ